MKTYAVDIAGMAGPPRLVQSACADEAARQLLQQGLMPLAVREVSAGERSKRRLATTPAALALALRQLGQLIEAGMPLDEALSLLARSEAKPNRALATRLLQAVREGVAISVALSATPGVSPIVAGIVRGAEHAGALPRGFFAAADFLDRAQEIRRAVWSALFYPMLLASVACLATLFILAVVIPEFAPLFQGEEAKLPWITRATLAASSLVVGRVWLIVLAGLSVAAVIAMTQSRRPGRFWLRLPLFRELALLQAASVLEVLGRLMQNGVDASDAMRLTAEAAQGSLLAGAFASGERRLREGESLARIFDGISALPASTRSLIQVGEASGQIGRSIVSAGRMLEQDTQHRINRLLAILNPAAVLLMGAVVALLVAGIMLGILGINQWVLR
ncbi:MAG: ral secretion pathway protein [Pseudomonadota bacterium]|jgi:type II secretory pathway component PulF